MQTPKKNIVCKLFVLKKYIICRQINGFPVYGVGQPTEEGIKSVIDKIDAGYNIHTVQKL